MERNEEKGGEVSPREMVVTHTIDDEIRELIEDTKRSLGKLCEGVGEYANFIKSFAEKSMKFTEWCGSFMENMVKESEERKNRLNVRKENDEKSSLMQLLKEYLRRIENKELMGDDTKEKFKKIICKYIKKNQKKQEVRELQSIETLINSYGTDLLIFRCLLCAKSKLEGKDVKKDHFPSKYDFESNYY